MSMLQNEMEIRKVVRETYLVSFYNNTPLSLTNIQMQKVPSEECQIAVYIFVVGDNPDGPIQSLSNPIPPFP
jgi:hypothetical protein